MKQLQKNLVCVVIMFVLLWISIPAMASEKTVCASASIGVYLMVPPVRNVYVDPNGSIVRIVSNIRHFYGTPKVYDESGYVVPMSDKIKQQYNELVPTVDFNGVGIRYGRSGSQPNTNIQEKNSKVEAEIQKTSPEANRVRSIPTRVIFVDANDTILRIVSNTPDNEIIPLVRKGGRWLHGSVPTTMNEKIQQQYEELLPTVNWKGGGIRYDSSKQ